LWISSRALALQAVSNLKAATSGPAPGNVKFLEGLDGNLRHNGHRSGSTGLPMTVAVAETGSRVGCCRGTGLWAEMLWAEMVPEVAVAIH
jgi:hypothetical protein